MFGGAVPLLPGDFRQTLQGIPRSTFAHDIHEKFQQHTEFKRGRIIGIRARGFSYHAIGAHVQWNSSTVTQVWKQRADEPRTIRETSSGRRKGNLNSNRYVCEVLRPKVATFLQSIPGDIFLRDNARPRVAKTVRDFCSAQRMQLFPWPAYSLDMSPNEYVLDLVGRCLARDPSPAASKDEHLLRIEAI
ncbi:hypothetical protein TNCV_4297131 [Trichonephila clavipes]|nr:hypothetical protein TNCV_4297131 [Trichonephila clavipes]